VTERWTPSLDDYIDLAAYLLGADRAAVRALPRIALAESALHAPFASFGGVDAYPTLLEQAAVLLQHLAKNHPLPDANKRAAFLLTARDAGHAGDMDRMQCQQLSACARHRRARNPRDAPGDRARRPTPRDWRDERAGLLACREGGVAESWVSGHEEEPGAKWPPHPEEYGFPRSARR